MFTVVFASSYVCGLLLLVPLCVCVRLLLLSVMYTVVVIVCDVYGCCYCLLCVRLLLLFVMCTVVVIVS